MCSSSSNIFKINGIDSGDEVKRDETVTLVLVEERSKQVHDMNVSAASSCSNNISISEKSSANSGDISSNYFHNSSLIFFNSGLSGYCKKKREQDASSLKRRVLEEELEFIQLKKKTEMIMVDQQSELFQLKKKNEILKGELLEMELQSRKQAQEK